MSLRFVAAERATDPYARGFRALWSRRAIMSSVRLGPIISEMPSACPPRMGRSFGTSQSRDLQRGHILGVVFRGRHTFAHRKHPAKPSGFSKFATAEYRQIK